MKYRLICMFVLYKDESRKLVVADAISVDSEIKGVDFW